MSWQTELEKRMKGFEKKVAKVGWLETAKYPDGKPVAEVALIHELGAPGANIPARPFIAPTIEAQGEKWKENLSKGVQAVIRGATTAEDVLTIVGQQAAGDIRKTISEVREPELAPATIAQRMREGRTDQPLNRTGLMIATCTSVVGDDN